MNNKELIDALVGMVEYVTKGQAYQSKNHYSQKPVADALRALCAATGHSSFGYDYLDVIEKIREGEKDVPKTD